MSKKSQIRDTGKGRIVYIDMDRVTDPSISPQNLYVIGPSNKSLSKMGYPNVVTITNKVTMKQLDPLFNAWKVRLQGTEKDSGKDIYFSQKDLHPNNLTQMMGTRKKKYFNMKMEELKALKSKRYPELLRLYEAKKAKEDKERQRRYAKEAQQQKLAATPLPWKKTIIPSTRIKTTAPPKVRGSVKIFKKPPDDQWEVSDVRKERKAIFVFGDNDKRDGYKNQAIIRGEPNAFGIPTKKLPSPTKNAYYSNDDFSRVKRIYDREFDKLQAYLDQGQTIYLPKDGLGTGLAKLETRASDIWKYLLQKIAELKSYGSPPQGEPLEPQGENIWSKGSQFAKQLTNLGNDLKVVYKGVKFRNAEHAYQTWKSGKFDDKAFRSTARKPRGGRPVNKKTNFQEMVAIIIAKLQQHPQLVIGIEQRGGLPYIKKSWHKVTGRDSFWESGPNKQNKFIEALALAYTNVKPPFKIISGGQSGIDMYGLRVAESMGLPTGGTLPKGYLWIPPGKKSKDKEPHSQEIIDKFRLEDHDTSTDWRPRTRKNVKDSDMTMLFNYGSQLSPGSKLVKKIVAEMPGKILKIYNIKGINGDQTKMKAMVSQIVKDLQQNKPRVLNIAGNRLDDVASIADGGKKKEAIKKWFPLILKSALSEYLATASPRQVTARKPTKKRIQMRFHNRFAENLQNREKTITTRKSDMGLKVGDKGIIDYFGQPIEATLLGNLDFQTTMKKVGGINNYLRGEGLLQKNDLNWTLPSGSDIPQTQQDIDYILQRLTGEVFKQWVGGSRSMYIFRLSYPQRTGKIATQPKSTATQQTPTEFYDVIMEGNPLIVPKSIIFVFYSSYKEIKDKEQIPYLMAQEIEITDIISHWVLGTLTRNYKPKNQLVKLYGMKEFGEGIGSCFIIDVHLESEDEQFTQRIVYMLTEQIRDKKVVQLSNAQKSEGREELAKTVDILLDKASLEDFPNLLFSYNNLRRNSGVFTNRKALFKLFNVLTERQQPNRNLYILHFDFLATLDAPFVRPKRVGDAIGLDAFRFISQEDYLSIDDPSTLREETEGKLIFVHLYPRSSRTQLEEMGFIGFNVDNPKYDATQGLFPYMSNSILVDNWYQEMGDAFHMLADWNAYKNHFKDVKVEFANTYSPRGNTVPYMLVQMWKPHVNFHKNKYKDTILQKFKNIHLRRADVRTLLKDPKNQVPPFTPTTFEASDDGKNKTYILNLASLSNHFRRQEWKKIIYPNLPAIRKKAPFTTVEQRMNTFKPADFVSGLKSVSKRLVDDTPKEKITYVVDLSLWNLSEEEVETLLTLLFPLVDEYPQIHFIFVGAEEKVIQEADVSKVELEELIRSPREFQAIQLAEPEIIGWIAYVAPYTKFIQVEGKIKKHSYSKIITAGTGEIFTPGFVPWDNVEDYATDFIQACFEGQTQLDFRTTEYDGVETSLILLEHFNVSLPTRKDGQRFFGSKYFNNLRSDTIDVGDQVKTSAGTGEVQDVDLMNNVVTIGIQQIVKGELTYILHKTQLENVIKAEYKRVGLFALYNSGKIEKVNTKVDARGSSIVLKKYPSSVFLSFSPYDPFHFDLMKEVFDFEDKVNAYLKIQRQYPASLQDVNILYNKLEQNNKIGKGKGKLMKMNALELCAQFVYFRDIDKANYFQTSNDLFDKDKRSAAWKYLKAEGVTEKNILDGERRIYEESQFRKRKMMNYIRITQSKGYIKYEQGKGMMIEVLEIGPPANPLNKNLYLFVPSITQLIAKDEETDKYKMEVWYKKMIQNKQFIQKRKFIPLSEQIAGSKSVTNAFSSVFREAWKKETEKVTENLVNFATKRFKPSSIEYTPEQHMARLTETQIKKTEEVETDLEKAYYGYFNPEVRKAANIFPRFFKYRQDLNISITDPIFDFPKVNGEPQIKKIPIFEITGQKTFKLSTRSISSKLDLFNVIGNFINMLSPNDEGTRQTPSANPLKQNYKERDPIVSEGKFNERFQAYVDSINIVEQEIQYDQSIIDYISNISIGYATKNNAEIKQRVKKISENKGKSQKDLLDDNKKLKFLFSKEQKPNKKVIKDIIQKKKDLIQKLKDEPRELPIEIEILNPTGTALRKIAAIPVDYLMWLFVYYVTLISNYTPETDGSPNYKEILTTTVDNWLTEQEVDGKTKEIPIYFDEDIFVSVNEFWDLFPSDRRNMKPETNIGSIEFNPWLIFYYINRKMLVSMQDDYAIAIDEANERNK